MGYRKEIKALRKRVEMFTAELREAERDNNWGRVAYLAGEINALAWDLRTTAESKQLSDW